VTNHDIKAVEYYIKEKMSAASNLADFKEYVHFTCTSEDINNISYALMLTAARKDVVGPEFSKLYSELRNLSEKTKGARMISRTHGQSATPTTMGKEVANYCYRLHRLNARAEEIRFTAKLNGAVGNYNAHLFVYPEIDWLDLSRTFVEGLGLEWAPYSTQIENHDSMCLYFAHVKHLNTVLIGLSRDFWHYISLGYFKQKTVKGEIGSSTMPHKVNPIDFENAEGNLGLANAMFGHFAEKLPISRFQRDLSDSTVLRNAGMALGYSLLASASLRKGLGRIEANTAYMAEELDSHWELLAEPVQMLLRRHNVADPYEKMKELTRGSKVDQAKMREFIDKLEVDDSVKQKLKALTPGTYLGHAERLAGELNKFTELPKK
jgi:adenylosuccinate lyase